MRLGARGLALAIAVSGALGSVAPAFGQSSLVHKVPEGGAPSMYLALAGLACAAGVVWALRGLAAKRSAN